MPLSPALTEATRKTSLSHRTGPRLDNHCRPRRRFRFIVIFHDIVVISRLIPTGMGYYHEHVSVQIATTITKVKTNRRHRTLHQATTWNHRLVSASRLSASRLERGLATRSLSCCNVLVVIMVIKITRIVVATLPEPL